MTVPVLAALLIGAALQQQTDTTVAVRADASLRVDVDGKITVRTWNRSAVRVQATHDRRTRIDVRGGGSTLRIDAEHERRPRAIDITLTVPPGIDFNAEGTSLDADVNGIEGEIDLETVQGTLRVNGGRGSVRVESVEGNIFVTGASGSIDVSTVNRGIHLVDVSGTVSAETVNGPIVMERMQASAVSAETVNGTIVYDGMLRARGEYELSTHNGSVWFVVPPDADASINITTYTGSVDPGFPLTLRKSQEDGSQGFSFVLGNGSADVTIESFGGDVHLRRPGDPRPRFRSN